MAQRNFQAREKQPDADFDKLESWVGGDPCSGAWIGVRCSRGRVVGVFLDNASLVGGLAPLLLQCKSTVLHLGWRGKESGPENEISTPTACQKHAFEMGLDPKLNLRDPYFQ